MMRGLISRRVSRYTTIAELGPIIPSVVCLLVGSLPNGFTCGPSELWRGNKDAIGSP